MLQQALRRKIGRMGLASEHYLNRVPAVFHNPLQTFDIPENQSRTFIFSKAPDETDSQHLRMKQGAHRQHLLRLHLRFAPAPLRPPQQSPLKLALQKLPGCPHLLIRYIQHTVPVLRVVLLLKPIRSQIFIVKALHFQSYPCWHMNSIGYMRNGDFVFLAFRPELMPHLSRRLAMKLAHCVALLAQRQGEHRHVANIATTLMLSQFQECLAIHFQRAPVVMEVLVNELHREHIVTCRDRSMSGENSGCPHPLDCLIVSCTLFYLLSHTLQHHEGCMSLVSMPYRRFNAQGTENSHAPDPQHYLLLDAHLPGS